MPEFGRRIDGLNGRRNSPRNSVILAGSARAISGSRSVVVSDISPTGARLLGRDLPTAGADVLITVGPIEVFGQISWSQADGCGLKFEQALTGDELGRMQQQGDWALVTGPVRGI